MAHTSARRARAFARSAMPWEAVLHVHSSNASAAVSGAAAQEAGWIVECHGRMSPLVTVELHATGERRSVAMQWQDRPEYFDLFVRDCGATFRVAACF